MAARAQRFPFPKTVIGFRPEHLDFRRGIHVGNLEEHERITRILKLELEHRFAEPFVTERYGRGVYWQWIAFLPRRTPKAQPQSVHARARLGLASPVEVAQAARPDGARTQSAVAP
jgi:hypothetical protein